LHHIASYIPTIVQEKTHHLLMMFLYGGFLKWWYPTTMGFPTKNNHFGVFRGYHHLRKHPYGVWQHDTTIPNICITALTLNVAQFPHPQIPETPRHRKWSRRVQESPWRNSRRKMSENLFLNIQVSQNLTTKIARNQVKITD